MRTVRLTNAWCPTSEGIGSCLPVVGPASGGVSTYAHVGNCLLVQSEPAALAAAVREVQGDAARTIARVAAAREAAKRFGWPLVCFSLLDLYAEIHALTAGVRDQAVLPPDFISTEEHAALEKRFA